MRRTVPFNPYNPGNLRQRRGEITGNSGQKQMSATPTSIQADLDEFASIRQYMKFDKDGLFNGTITAGNLSTDELIDLFATIMVKPRLAEKIKFLDLSNPDVKTAGLITAIPRLKGFSGLKVIRLYGQQLKSVPEGWLDDCTSLEELHLHRNNLVAVPENLFKNCKSLKVVNFHDNALPSLPAALFAGCTSLQKLYLCNNKLAQIPEQFLKDCVALQEFDVSNNLLNSLPKQLFVNCKNLLKLYLQNNQISELYEELLYECVALTDLHISGNVITVLPQRLLYKCVELSLLVIGTNKLTEIPYDFTLHCKKLTSFNTNGLPVATKPPPPPRQKETDKPNVIEPTPISDVTNHSSFPIKAFYPRALHPMEIVRREREKERARKELEQKEREQKNSETVTLTAAEHAELLQQKTRTAQLEQTVADIQQQLRELQKVPLAVEVKQEFTSEEKAIFVKTDVLEAKLADKLHDSRITTVNVLLEQANVLIPQHTEQNQALIKKIEELIWSAHKSEERAANAEQIALMAIAELRNFKEQTMQSLEFISQHMTENETFLYEAIVRINKLGSAFTVLSAEIGKNNQYSTICNALNEGKHQGAATFMIAFVSKFTTETTFATLAASKKFKFDYGNYGLVSDTLVAIANMVPVTGVGALATVVQMAVKKFEDRKKIASANKIVNTSGKIVGGAEELATRIAVSILQLNGHIIAKCPPEVASEIAKLCFDAAIKYITTTPKDQTEISAEEIAYAIMNGKFLDLKSCYGGYVLSFDSAGCLLTTRANPDNPTKAREWLSDTLMQYGKNPERFDDMPLPAPRTSAFLPSRKSVTLAFDAFKSDVQKRPEPVTRVSPENKKRFEVS